MTDKKFHELIEKVKKACDVCVDSNRSCMECTYRVGDCQTVKSADTIQLIEELKKHMDVQTKEPRTSSVVDDAREKALISAYQTISKVLDGSKNGPELLSAIPIADGAARIAKAIEENRNMNTTAEATLALGKIVEEAAKNAPISNGGVILGK